MAKITYIDKEPINIDPTIPAKNKCMADDMNEIKNVVNENENKTLIAISSTAPSECTTGDLYYNTTSKKIFTATATDTWSSTGENPTENTLYLCDNTIYSYDGTDLVKSSGSDEVYIGNTQPTGDEVVWINPDEIIIPSGEESTYSTSETDTGKKWINDKTIYRKVITKDGEHNSTLFSKNIETTADALISATIMWENATGRLKTINAVPIALNISTTTSAIQTNLDSGILPVYNIKVIIEYTKS